ncbi:MAG: C40 family peptidase [Lachnospiraceae bacterium]|nr:C40 family peptidase [Lachnospiraceae bacterium]
MRLLAVKAPVVKVFNKLDDISLSDELLHGMIVKVIEETAGCNYLKVLTEYNYAGWCNKDCFCAAENIISYYSDADCLRIHSLTVDVMDRADIKGKVLCTLVKGSIVYPVNVFENGWTKVLLASSSIGYIRTSSIVPYENMCGKKNIRRAIIEDALMYLGTQYRWGGKTPYGIDCSGLCSMAYLNNGMIIHRDSGWQDGYGIKQIPVSEAMPGDLLYFKGHIALYMGNDLFIHSTLGVYGDGVRINSLNKSHALYREDLLDKLICAGTLI